MNWDWGSCFIGIFIGAMGVLVSGMLADKKEEESSYPVDFCTLCKEQACAGCERVTGAREDVKALDRQLSILRTSNAALRRDNKRLYDKLYSTPSTSRLLWDIWAGQNKVSKGG